MNNLSKPDGKLSVFAGIAAFLASIVTAPNVGAQNTTAGESNNTLLEEVIVTAQKREQTLQDVPISILVTSGEVMQNERLTRLEDIMIRLPNVIANQAGANEQTYIRGVGSGFNAGFELSVGTFIDGIYHGRSRLTRTNLVDIEQVELLRGPQSTYFGNNTIAGAFNITTRDPGDTWEGYLQPSYEFEHEEVIIEGAVGGPISDTLRVRVAGRYESMDGWVKNLTTGDNNPDTEERYLRFKAVWTPTDKLTFKFKVEHSRDDRDGGWFLQMINCPPEPPFTSPGRACAARVGDPAFEDEFNLKREGNAGEDYFLDIDEFVLNAEYFWKDISLTSVTGYIDYGFNLKGDSDVSSAEILGFQQPEGGDQISQEIRIASTGNKRLEWMVGGYYQKEKINVTTDVAFPFLTPILNAVPAAAPLLPFANIGISAFFDQESETVSAFASATWKFTERLRVTAGLRWTEVEKNIVQSSGCLANTDHFGSDTLLPSSLDGLCSAFTGTVPHSNAASRTDDDLIPSANIQFDLTDALTSYFSFSEGFKSGGFDSQDFQGDVTRITYGPESVKSYELGLKGYYPEYGLSFNINGFYSDYKDLQQSVAQFIGLTFGFSISNVGGLDTKGIEADLNWAINDHWRLSLAGALLDAKYTDFPGAGCTAAQLVVNPAGQVCVQDLSGEPPPNAPDYSGSVSLDFNNPIGNNLEFFTSGTVSFRGSYLIMTDNEPVLEQDDWAKLDIRVGVRTMDDRWELAFLGRNLTNEYTMSFGNDVPTTPGSFWVQIDRPRTFAIQARYNWQ